MLKASAGHRDASGGAEREARRRPLHVYIYTCVCVYIYIYVNTCMYVCMYVCMYIYIYRGRDVLHVCNINKVAIIKDGKQLVKLTASKE